MRISLDLTGDFFLLLGEGVGRMGLFFSNSKSKNRKKKRKKPALVFVKVYRYECSKFTFSLVLEKSWSQRNRATTRPSSSDNRRNPGTLQSICATIPCRPRNVSTRLWKNQTRTQNGNSMSTVLALLTK